MTNSYRGSVMYVDAKIIHFIRMISDMIIEGDIPHSQVIVDLLYIILVSFFISILATKLNVLKPIPLDISSQIQIE